MNERFSNKDYNQLGVDAANLFITKKEDSLMDAVLKVANDSNLTAIGVERLAEKANQFTQMSILTNAADKKMEFDVVNPAIAAKQYEAYNRQESINKQASSLVENHLTEEIPDFSYNSKLEKAPDAFVNSILSTLSTNQQLEKEASTSDEELYKQLKKERNDLKAKIDSISLEKMAAYYKMEKILDDVVFEYGHVNAEPFVKVAYDAYGVWGDEIYPFIKHVSLSIRKPLQDSFIKEASEQTHVIDDTTSTMSKLASYIELQRTYFKSYNNIKKHQERLSEINTKMSSLGKGSYYVI